MLSMILFLIPVWCPWSYFWFQHLIQNLTWDPMILARILFLIPCSFPNAIMFASRILARILFKVPGCDALNLSVISQCYPRCYVWFRGRIQDLVSDSKISSTILFMITRSYPRCHFRFQNLIQDLRYCFNMLSRQLCPISNWYPRW